MNKIAKIVIVVASITLAFTACGEDKKKAAEAAKAAETQVVEQKAQDSVVSPEASDTTPKQKKEVKKAEITDPVRMKIEEKKLAAQEAAKAAMRAKAAAEANK